MITYSKTEVLSENDNTWHNWTKTSVLGATSSRAQLEIQVPSPLYPCCSRGICPMTISSSFGMLLQALRLTLKSFPITLSKNISTSCSQSIFSLRHGIFLDVAFFLQISHSTVLKMHYHTEIWTLSP